MADQYSESTYTDSDSDIDVWEIIDEVIGEVACSKS